jgi:hypothetical protein
MSEHVTVQRQSCSICSESLNGNKVWVCPSCGTAFHICCLAEASLEHSNEARTVLIPKAGWCGSCGLETSWGNIVLGVS